MPMRMATGSLVTSFDLNANTNGFKRQQVDDLAGEFPRFNERSAGLSYRHGFFAASSDSRFVDQFDTLAHLDLKTNKRTAYQLPKGDAVSEPIFIPRNANAREGDGSFGSVPMLRRSSTVDPSYDQAG